MTLPPSLSPSSWSDRRRELSRCGNERGIEKAKETGERGGEEKGKYARGRTRLHGVTRKYDAPKASRRGTKRPRHLNSELSSREASLEGPRGTRRSPPLLPSPSGLSTLPSSHRSLCSPLSRVAWSRTFAKGVPHTGPHRSPRYLSRQISRLRYTPCDAATTVRPLRRLPFPPVLSRALYSYVPVVSCLSRRVLPSLELRQSPLPWLPFASVPLRSPFVTLVLFPRFLCASFFHRSDARYILLLF